jgi:GDP-4-dehydro-6-deoxy-D-mannose reductase
MTRVLVVGASGFLGRHLCALLAGKGIDVLALSRSQPPDSSRKWLQADIQDAAAIGEILAETRPDVVVHLATPPRHAELAELIAVHVHGTDTLLGMVAANVPRARVLVVGSSAEYGQVGEDELPISEAVRPRPVSNYGLGKLMQAELVQVRARQWGLALCHARVFNVTGPGESADQVVGAIVKQLVQAEVGVGDGTIRVRRLDTIRDFLDVRDVASALWALAANPDATGIINVCSGTGVTIQAVLENLLQASTAQPEVVVLEDRPSPTDVPVQVGDPGRLAALTGFKPLIGLATSLQDTLEASRAAMPASVVQVAAGR